MAIVGAGASGLAACKACKEEGIDYICYEKTSRFAGLWNYHEDDEDGVASVMKSTVINSSKEMSAFSDFPPPRDFPNYMHNRKMFQYFRMYAEKHNLLDGVRYFHNVTSVVQAHDYEESGRWVVTTQNSRDGTVTSEVFDGVMVCTGHHGFPNIPHFEGEEEFKGKIIHTHSIKVPDTFKDSRVMIVGVGNSGLDAAVDISNVARQVYLSTRRGTWIMFRLADKGLPADTQLLTRIFDVMNKIAGSHAKNCFLENKANSKFDHSFYRLKPKHRFDAQHLAINDHLPNKILSGTVIVKGDIDRFCEKGVIFKGEENVTKLDAVVLATGYKFQFPLLSDSIIRAADNQVELFKYVFPPHLKHPTLAVIGLIQPFGSLFPIMENQSRWFAQVLNKKVFLPDKETMMVDIRKKREELVKRYVGSLRHTIQVDFIPYMDEVAAQYGAKPNLWKMALTDPLLFYHCFMGPCLPYQYRLGGPHAWPAARKAIVTHKDRITAPLKTRKSETSFDYLNSLTLLYFVSFLVLCGAIYLVSLTMEFLVL